MERGEGAWGHLQSLAARGVASAGLAQDRLAVAVLLEELDEGLEHVHVVL